MLGQADRVGMVRVLGDFDGERGGREGDEVGLVGVVEAQAGAAGLARGSGSAFGYREAPRF